MAGAANEQETNGNKHASDGLHGQSLEGKQGTLTAATRALGSIWLPGYCELRREVKEDWCGNDTRSRTESVPFGERLGVT